MKKIKLLAPILATVGAMGVIAPMLTSCKNQTNVNKVVLQDGQKLERTVTGGSGTLAFYFKQENALNPQDTKVYLKDFAINGLSGLHAPDKTIKYNADTAGNMRVIVDVESIYNNWNYVETISCTLLFKNKTAGTEYEVGPLTINLVEEGSAEAAESAEDSMASSIFVAVSGEEHSFTQEFSGFDNQTALISITLSEDEGYMPSTIYVEQDMAEMTEGKDYIYFTDGSRTGYVWLPNISKAENYITISIMLPAVNPVPARALNPFECNEETRGFDKNVLVMGEGDSLMSSITVKESSIDAYVCGYKNDATWFSENLGSNLSMATFTNYMDNDTANNFLTKLTASDVDQESSYILVKYNVTDTSDNWYYGSCAIQVEKDSGIGEVVEPDIHND